MSNVNIIRMKCPDCGGTMDIEKDKQVLQCPFCGSKNMIVESDAVKIERLRMEDKEKERGHREWILKENRKDFVPVLIMFGMMMVVGLVAIVFL